LEPPKVFMGYQTASESRILVFYICVIIWAIIVSCEAASLSYIAEVFIVPNLAK
jgi:hypothetical protein